MNNTRKTVTFIALLLLGWGGLTVFQSSQAASDPFTDFMNKDCVPGAQQSGLKKDEAQKGCTCTVNDLRKKYSTQAFRGLLNKYRNGDAKAKQTLRSYGETCFEKVLDDILFEN